MKLQHRLRSPAWQGGHIGEMPRGAQVSQGLSTTRWPDVEPRGVGPERHHLGHHLVPGHVGEGGEGRHRVVDVARVEVAEHELGVGAADPREDGSGDHPIGPDQARIVQLVQAEGDLRQGSLQLVLGGRADLVRIGRGAEEEGLHPPACCVKDRIPAMKASMSVVFASTTAFMSGR